jgi:pyruvate dehydrogenase E2 component (dihydrolipoamide acetyltransferase)
MTVLDQPVALSKMRRAVVRTVTASAGVPQYSVSVDAPVATVLAARDRARATVASASVSDVINAAVSRALVKHPGVNSSFSPEGIVTHSAVNLAFIVEVDDGMVAPAILDAASKSMMELAAERSRLTEAALAGTLRPEELLNGTFTVSNLGTLGVHRFNAMVLPPQAGILAVGAPTDGGLLSLTLTCDHRVVDGAPAARFLTEIVRQFEEVSA